MNDSWKDLLVDDDAGLREILQSYKRVAVLGIKTQAQLGQPAFGVPAYLLRHGFDIVPVPVYFPEVTEILGKPVFRSVAAVQPPAEVVQVFRRPDDVPAHVDDILAARPRVVWMQLGISNPQAAERFARAGIRVVQNRCMKVELGRLLGAGAEGTAPSPG